MYNEIYVKDENGNRKSIGIPQISCIDANNWYVTLGTKFSSKRIVENLESYEAARKWLIEFRKQK